MIRRAQRLLAPVLYLSCALPAAGADDAERVRWLAENAVAVRSVDPADEDFSDLMPLVRVIGSARVVQLGEVTHGDGATFLAKGRLVRFLHQVMGFDVLAWESGIFDVQRVDAALRAGAPAAEAARRGLYPAWQNQESMPSLDYVRASKATARPIDTVGFDCRIGTSINRKELYPQAIFAFFDRLDPALLSTEDRERFKAVSLAVNTLPMEHHWRPEIRQWLELPQRLLAALDGRRRELAALYSPREIDLVRRTLVSLLATERAIDPISQPAPPDGYDRDAAMAENLLWWLAGPLADRKVVVWSHNHHVMNHGYLAKDDAGEAAAVGGPMGRRLKAALGADLYTIGFTSHGGEYFDMDADKVVPVEPGPLEELLHAAGRAYLFLDLAGLPAGHWLRDRWTAGFHKYWPTESAWARVYDGVFFIDEQKPATTLVDLAP